MVISRHQTVYGEDMMFMTEELAIVMIDLPR